MTNKQRIDLIEVYIREHKYADLHSLADHFGGSLSTVRRALDTLEHRGIVRRHHGGASLVETDALAQEYDFLVRIQRQADQKLAIAALVADQVAPGMTLILDGGSTTYAIARLLAEKRVRVITNSLPVASLFGEIGNTETIIAAQRKMIAASERTVFALDDTKFGRKALSLTAPFGPQMTVVTNTRPPPPVEKAIATAGCRLTLAGK